MLVRKRKPSVIRSYLTGMVWCLIFWLGLNCLCGLAAGFWAATSAASGADGMWRGGMAGLQFTQQHDRLILILAGFLVSYGMSRGLLPGSGHSSSTAKQEMKEARDRALKIRTDILKRLAQLQAAKAKKA